MSGRKLGFGLMRLPLKDASDAASIDIETCKKMTDVFLERGFTYFDTAWMYHEYKSENAVKEILTDRYPRDAYTVTTKLHSAYLKKYEDMDLIFEEQLAKTGLEYFDYYWLHDINSESIGIFEEFDCFRRLQEYKEKGLVKHIGFSSHDGADFLDRLLTDHPEMEYVQLQINYLDWENSVIQSRRCYETAVKHGKQVIIMEPVKGGTLAKVPEEAEKMMREADPDASVSSWAVRFAASLPGVYMVLSGMSSMEQMLDNTSYMTDFKPLSEDEKSMLLNIADMINSRVRVPCTGCEYCINVCPTGIPIPKFFSLYNADLQEKEDKDWKPQGEYYVNLAAQTVPADACIRCGKCRYICPQHLRIPDLLQEVAEHFAGWEG